MSSWTFSLSGTCYYDSSCLCIWFFFSFKVESQISSGLLDSLMEMKYVHCESVNGANMYFVVKYINMSRTYKFHLKVKLTWHPSPQ